VAEPTVQQRDRDLVAAFNATLSIELSAYLSSKLAEFFARHREQVQSEVWQPIETAPKDGTRILAAWPRNHFGIVPISFARWDDDKYAQNPRPYWSACADERVWGKVAVRASQPTHWRPLPAPPEPLHKEDIR
jgi:hypothetical protein